MLVLTQKIGEIVWVGPDITITTLRVDSGRVRYGINAPKELLIHRSNSMEETRDDRPEIERGND